MNGKDRETFNLNRPNTLNKHQSGLSLQEQENKPAIVFTVAGIAPAPKRKYMDTSFTFQPFAEKTSSRG